MSAQDLKYHLAPPQILTPEQARLYPKLRAYPPVH